ncbi:MAG TPA: hypothetical protein DCL35_01000 [Candidatus Omnitrophica bacterium]|nr:hypothetical protein [Candidatus Omnitrophota bacterium]
MNKFITLAVIGILFIALAGAGFLYKTEVDKNQLLRAETLKTDSATREENKKLISELAKLKELTSQDNRAILEQMNTLTKERDAAVAELNEAKKSVLKERELSLGVNDDLEIFRKEVAVLRKEGRENIGSLEKSYNKKKQLYDTRILSLEASLAKCSGRLNIEAERYHYNLGVLYSQNKDYDSAVTEFKTALNYNPKNSNAHYNLGIIFDDYFKDKKNATYHYRTFLDLAPTSDEAESVKEWLKTIEK